MTEGKVVALGADVCRGWARITTLPRYAVTVHLVLRGRVQASTVADQNFGEIDDPSVSGNCWFEIDVPSDIASSLAECRVLVGESGTYLQDGRREGGAETACPASAQAPKSFRDALDRGLSASDVIQLLYLDILRRPADKIGLRFHLDELESGRGSLESFRRSLLASDEFRRLKLRVREAPGGTFARSIAYLSSSRRLNVQQYSASFQRLNVPLRRKLLEYLPGIVALPGTLETLVAMGDKGVPAREIFHKALSKLSCRPSLIVGDRRELGYDGVGKTALDTDGTLTVDCASPHFIQGWNKLEQSPSKTYRWMEQVGIFLNPAPDRKVVQIEVGVEEWYGNLDRTITGLADGTVLTCERREKDNGATLVFTSPDASPIVASRVALVAGGAACPWSYDGTPDMRLVSCQVTSIRLQYAEAA